MKFSNELEALINDAIADGVITPDEQAALLKKALLSGADPKDVEAEINSRLAQMKAAKPKASVHDLDSLIEEYLTDGIISDKERQVLLRKAQGLGLDLDEVDLYIDAQQQKADQKVEAAVSRKRGATCPYCGGSIPQLADKCPHCGQNITAEASEELQEIFDQLEDALVKFKSGEDISKSKAEVERYVRKAKMYYENNPKVKRLLDQVEEESAAAEESAQKNARMEILRKYKWLIGIVAIIILGFVGFKLFYTSPADYMNQANEAIEQYDFDKAMRIRESCSDLAAQGQIYRAIIAGKNKYVSYLISNGEYDKAEKFIKETDNPEPEAYEYIGDFWEAVVRDMVSKGNKAEAKDYVERIILPNITTYDEYQHPEIREKWLNLVK